MNLRSFPYSITFSPRNPKESRVVKSIIRSLKMSMAAKAGEFVMAFPSWEAADSGKDAMDIRIGQAFQRGDGASQGLCNLLIKDFK